MSDREGIALGRRDGARVLGTGEQTAAKWHDLVGGPRDSVGRRLFTDEVLRQIRVAREQVRRP